MRYRWPLMISVLTLAIFVPSCANGSDEQGPGCVCSEGEVCDGGECKIACDEESDACRAGLVCLGGVCVSEFRCSSDDECPGGRCVNGGCYSLECADADTRECSTECGAGVETCADGVWRACDAPIPRVELCANEVDDDCNGEVDEGCSGCVNGEERPCETACGTDVAACVNGEWLPCAEEGECQPDETAQEECGTCGGVRARVCSEQCVWGEAGDCVVPASADCAPGESETRACQTDGAQLRRCQESCTWGDWGHCFL